MKVRIKFQKYGAMKFIGHLDVMRYFQKAFRRANVDNEYSKGFSPHQIMSFAAPLGVGLTSDAEYLDASLLSCEAPEVMIEKINGVLTEGFRVIDFRILKEPEVNQKIIHAMALVSSADYLVSLKDGYSISETIQSQEDFIKAFEGFMEQAEIIITKKTKKSEQAVDIKPMISLVAFSQEDYQDKLSKVLHETVKVSDYFEKKSESKADLYDKGIKVFLQVDTGSVANLKPELVMEAFFEYLGLAYQSFAFQVHRLELYTRLDGKILPLDLYSDIQYS